MLSTVIGGNYAIFSGTSMATPHVSGSAALVLSMCALNTAALKSQLLNNVDPDPALSGLTITGGRLNVDRALRGCAGGPTPDFSLAVSPSSQTAVQGQSTTYTVNVGRTGGFTGSVTLGVSGLPTGATGSFNPNPAGGASSTLMVSTGASTPTGSFALSVTGTSGALSHSSATTLVVSSAAQPDFTLSASPASSSVTLGARTSYTITINRLNGFASGVSLSIGGLPGTTTASFSPNPATGGSSTLRVRTRSGTPTGTFTLTITGSGGGLTRTTQVTLVVT